MIHFVIGTKAQLIKTAPVMKELTLRGIEYNYISTGQHRETIDDILANFSIKEPDHKLYDGKDITSVGQMILWSVKLLYKAFRSRKEIFGNDKNGIVLVHGDTLSTVLGALMGKFAGIRVGHIESGLRSFNMFQPFPEEIFRLMTFRLSDVMFCPGDWAVSNLKKYKCVKVNTFVNTLYDSLKEAEPAIDALTNVVIPEADYAVATLHRFENVKDRKHLEKIVRLIESISKKIKVVFILHKITEKNLNKFGLIKRLQILPGLELRQRYDYFRFIKLIKNSSFVISDGGSNQEECFYLGKPVLLFRNVSERNEGLGENAVLSRFDPAVIENFTDNYSSYAKDPLTAEKKPSSIIADYCIELVS